MQVFVAINKEGNEEHYNKTGYYKNYDGLYNALFFFTTHSILDAGTCFRGKLFMGKMHTMLLLTFLIEFFFDFGKGFACFLIKHTLFISKTNISKSGAMASPWSHNPA